MDAVSGWGRAVASYVGAVASYVGAEISESGGPPLPTELVTILRQFVAFLAKPARSAYGVTMRMASLLLICRDGAR